MKYTGLIIAFVASFILEPILNTASAGAKVIRIYHDSDYSSHASSAESMKMGFMTALDEINYQIAGYQIEFVPKDHRGNVVRSLRTMKQFQKDPQALFVMGGLHSPPYLKHKKFINENGILLLVPWAAAGPITRYNEGTNWVFRLSVDDTKAGLRISDFAVNTHQCKSPHLLLENTGWGKSNFRSITGFFETHLSVTPAVSWFNWNTKANAAKVILRDIARTGSDCLIFVGNAIEAAIFMRAITELNDFNLPILSHWGITGGDFPQKLGPEILSKLNLHFIQSCFSFVSSPETDTSKAAFQRAVKLFPETLSDYSSLNSPTGFIHAYDLARLVIQAMKKMSFTDNMTENRKRLRDELEQLKTPLRGLIKTYQQPFSRYSADNPDAHEALGLDDLCMAKFTPKGVIEVLSNRDNATGSKFDAATDR